LINIAIRAYPKPFSINRVGSDSVGPIDFPVQHAHIVRPGQWKAGIGCKAPHYDRATDASFNI
jgi:hypothetical protein